MTLTEISAQKQQIEQKHIRNMQKLKVSYIFELAVAAFISVVDMFTSKAENHVATGFVILLVLAVIVTAWNAIVFYVYKKEKENKLAKLRAVQRRLEEQKQKEQEQHEARDRTRAAQEALISLARSKGQDLNKHPTNCPNCGALLDGSVCSYCGTHT